MVGAFGEAGGDVLPGIGHELLQAERDLLVVLVEGKNLEFEFLTEGHHFARMTDALPGHIGDMQEAVEAAEVNEHAVFGDVLGLALDDLAFFEVAHFGGDVTFQKFFEAHFSVDLVFHVFGSCHCTDPPT